MIVPCGGKKADTAAPAGELYVGSYHRAARRAADALTSGGGRVLILSALHGLVELDTMLEPYELRAGQAGTVTGETLRAQAAAFGIADADVAVLGGRAYVELARQVWPTLSAPMEGTRRAERLAKEARRRAAYVTADTLRIAAGRASVRFSFPTGSGTARVAARIRAARRFAAANGVTAAQLDAATLQVHGIPARVARFASALPRLIELVEGYTALVVRHYGRWERRSSARRHLDGLVDAERRAHVRAFRARAFDVIVDTLLRPDVEPAPQLDGELPLWEQADAIAAQYAEYGWFDVTGKADAAEIAALLAAAIEAPAAPALLPGLRVHTRHPRPARRPARQAAPTAPTFAQLDLFALAA
ncbi:DUF6884 domain-containing protein [Nonomuraea candida]|uniref:DUF6884 domain-containing protein n=1 Tax=Nonomuraea candida TaxID=359159 RepID=UPI0006939BF9|nr:DUF6884 domain-containing protein [Nonomuraea candida]